MKLQTLILRIGKEKKYTGLFIKFRISKPLFRSEDNLEINLKEIRTRGHELNLAEFCNVDDEILASVRKGNFSVRCRILILTYSTVKIMNNFCHRFKQPSLLHP